MSARRALIPGVRGSAGSESSGRAHRRGPREKVVLLISSLSGGGAERVFVTLLRHLDRGRFEPHLVLLRGEGELIRQIPRDVVVHDLDARRFRHGLPGHLLAMWDLVRVLWKIRPRTVLATGGMSLALVLARPLLPPSTGLLIRECSVLSVRLKSDTHHPYLWAWLYRWLYRWADTVICQSDAMVTDLADKLNLPRQRMVRIYNPVDIDLVRELSGNAGNPYSDGGPRLVAAGRLSHEKGFDRLLAAMPRILECLPNVRLAILGEGPLESALVEQVRSLGLTQSVSFLGFQQNPWPYLRHADLLVLPSRREAFGNVLLEAAALEIPAVAAECPGALAELYGDNPAVRLVRAEDPGVLAAAILDRLRAAADGLAKPKAPPDWLTKFAVPRILEEYSALLAGGRSPHSAHEPFTPGVSCSSVHVDPPAWGRVRDPA